MRDFGTKIDNSSPADSGRLKAEEFNVIAIELEKSVSSGGIELDPAVGPDANLEALSEAMSRYASGGVFYEDSGAANAYLLDTPSGVDGFVMPKSYFDGMQIEFYPTNNCTGASTVNVNGIGVKSIKRPDGTDLAANDILTDVSVVARYDETADYFRISPWSLQQAAEVSGTAGSYLNLQIYPEITTNNGVLSLTSPSASNLTVDTGGRIIHRGWREYLTDDYVLASRQLTTAANKTYHLRWSPANAFQLKDLANGTYNPSALDEDNEAFDTTYDDMLVARVVTDGSNNLTITNLINRSRITGEISKLTEEQTTTWLPALVTDLNWSRTPQISFRAVDCELSVSTDAITIFSCSATRYSATSYAYGYNNTGTANGYNNGSYRLELFA